MITIDDPISAAELAHRIRNNQRNSSVRKGNHLGNVSRNERKMRNQSARLPMIDRPTPRYEDERETTDMNILNFVKASRRQMKGAIGQQQPQARRFIDDSLANLVADPSMKSATNKDLLGEMPSFSKNQMNRGRPSIHSVANSVHRKLKLSLAKMDEESDAVSSHQKAKGPFQIDNLSGMLSPPPGLSKNISKVSLITDSYHVGAGQQSMSGPGSLYNSQRKNNNSPTASSMTMQVFGRELKHINKYLDGREMQIRNELENTTKLDSRLEQNKNLSDLFHQIMISVRTKLPPNSSTLLNDLVKRIMDGLSESFELQTVTYTKKVDVRNKKIEQLKTELDAIKASFAEFKKESTVDAFFKKHTDIVDRTGRRQKDYIKDLNKVVDDYLDTPDELESMQGMVDDKRMLAKEAEPSGVESMLIQLQQISGNIQVPGVPDNPLVAFDAEKDNVMKDFKRALNKEAQNMRNVVEHKVKDSLGLVKPTREAEVQTLTYKRIKDEIMNRGRLDIEIQVTKQTEEKFALKMNRWMKEIQTVEEKNALLKQKMAELQGKLVQSDGAAFIADMRDKIIVFWNMKLGKGSAALLKEFNKTVMDVKTHEMSANKLLKSISSFHEEQSELSRRSIANQFDSIIKSAESRKSEQSMVRVIDRQGSIERGLASQGSTVNIENAQIVKEVNSRLEKDNYTPDQSPSRNSRSRSPETRRIVTAAKKKQSQPDNTKEGRKDNAREESKGGKDVESPQGTAMKAPPKTAVDSEKQQDDAAPDTVEGKMSPAPSRGVSPDKQSAAGETERQTPFNKRGKSEMKSPKNSVKTKKTSNAGSKLQEQGQDATDAPVIDVVGDSKTDHKDLLKKISGSKKIRDAILEFQTEENLKVAVKQAEKTVTQLVGLESAVDVMVKIVKLNADNEALQGEASTLKLTVLEMGMEDLDVIKATQQRAIKGQQMHELLDSTYQFYKKVMTDRKNKKVLPERESFLEHIANMQKITEMVPELPTQDEIEHISNISNKCTMLEKKLTSLISRKFVKIPPPPTAIITTTTIEEQLPATTETVPEKNEIGDAIASISLVRCQIQDSHSVILNAKSATPNEQKVLIKVNRLLTHMDEAVQWLEQKRNDADAFIVVSDTEDLNTSSRKRAKSLSQKSTKLNFQDREKMLKKKVNKHDQINEWDGAHPPATPPPISDSNDLQTEVSNFGERKNTEPNMSKKIIQMQEKAHNYLTANDIDIVQEDAQRENSASKVSSYQRRNASVAGSDAGNLHGYPKSQLGLIGEEDTDGGEQDENKKGIADRRSSRIEVFRKTPNKLAVEDQQLPQSAVLHISDTESTPMGRIPNPETSGGQTPAAHDRKQFADLDLESAEMTYTFAHGADPNAKKDQISQPVQIKGQQSGQSNHIAAPMRQSQETDYLQTASHFGNETFRADLNRINVGIIAASPNPNETQNFLNKLKEQVAVDQRQDGATPASYSIKQDGKSQRDATTPAPGTLNQDLEETGAKLLEGSQASSIDNHDLGLLDTPLQPAHYAGNARLKAKPSAGSKHFITPNGSLVESREIKMPSALKITQKPVHGLIKVDDTMSRLGYDLNQYSQLSSKMLNRKPPNTVLMLTQATQTENRVLIKELLTLINETIMKQLESQSVQMTPEEFQEQVTQLKEAIPAVYDNIKGQSDTFFIEKMLGPQFTTNALNDTTATQIKLTPHHSNMDLLNVIPEPVAQLPATTQTHQTARTQHTAISHSTGIANIVVGKKNLSPSTSMHTLQRDVSNQRLLDQALSQNPSQEQLRSQQQVQVQQQQQSHQITLPKKQPYLSLGDFSRYGSHTLEISQEVRTRVNLRQVGAAGGGFMGRGVKVPAPCEHK